MSDLSVPYPWTIATAFGPIMHGPETDRWMPLWRNQYSAQTWADHCNKGGFGQHLFAVPLPELGDKAGRL